MSTDTIITNDDHMTIKNNKKRGIKENAIISTVLLVIFEIITVFKSDEFTGGLMLMWFALFAVIFLILIIPYYFQKDIFIEISGEEFLLRKYSKKATKISSGDIAEVKFSESWRDADGIEYPYTVIIKYENNKKYKLPLSDPLEIKKIEDFFIQYCQKRNIKVIVI